MVERQESKNIAGELLLQQAADAERIARAVVSKIEEVEKNGRKYKTVYFSNGEKVNVFNPKLIAGIAVGQYVEFALAKNDKGFWNLAAMHPLEERPPEPTPQQSAIPLEPPTYLPREPDTREHGMRSMNALTNAVTLIVALIGKDILQPKDGKEAFKMVEVYHEQMMHLHEPRRGELP